MVYIRAELLATVGGVSQANNKPGGIIAGNYIKPTAGNSTTDIYVPAATSVSSIMVVNDSIK